MGVQERARERTRIDKDRAIKNQAKVIKELWHELQTLKRILMDEHLSVWKEIQHKTNHYHEE